MGEPNNQMGGMGNMQPPMNGAQTVEQGDVWVQLQDFGRQQMNDVKPWSEFVDRSKMSAPRSTSDLTDRIRTNIRRFLPNYILISAGLFVYCIVTSPMLLIGLAFGIGGAYYVQTKANPIMVGSIQIQVHHQFALVGVVTLILLYLASAGSVIFWIIGASITIIAIHAACVTTENLGDWSQTSQGP
eukprot:Clim_evm19s165 gene=Clim_evmTU19s165